MATRKGNQILTPPSHSARHGRRGRRVQSTLRCRRPRRRTSTYQILTRSKGPLDDEEGLGKLGSQGRRLHHACSIPGPLHTTPTSAGQGIPEYRDAGLHVDGQPPEAGNWVHAAEPAAIYKLRGGIRHELGPGRGTSPRHCCYAPGWRNFHSLAAASRSTCVAAAA